MSLPQREVGAVFVSEAVERHALLVGINPPVGIVSMVDQVRWLQGNIQDEVIVLAEGVEIGAHGSDEENWVLRNDGDVSARVWKPSCAKGEINVAVQSGLRRQGSVEMRGK